ncbi:response regulator [Nitrincola schmidtii]|uniref:response regulator n=1 Tax=Nitrincola schmidtii TaxID=1730894 RepID=UPI00124DC01A|nr:response regulator [Nitrincola schmidtii]
MNPRKITYADKHVLLIESSGNMRATIVQMLRQLGVANIKPVTVNARVLEIIQEERFDIVLLGHNASDKVTGIQLLEEARYRNYMRPSTGWIFMTSDASQQVILHAIDSNPDYLLTKPFTVEELKHRIDALIVRKQLLKDVDEAVERGDLKTALSACDQVSVTDPSYDFAQRYKGRLLLQLKRADEALNLLQERYWQNSDKDTGLLIAQALLALKQADAAIQQLQELIENHPLLVPALDLLAQAYEMNGDLQQARDVLHEAARKSPLGIPRQMELGRIATQTRTLNLAEGAFKRSIVLGRSSCYKSPEPYLRLANIRRLEMQDADKDKQIELHNDLDALLNHAQFSFPKDESLKVKSLLIRSQTYKDLGKQVKADGLQREAEKLNAQLPEPIDLAREAILLSGDAVPVLEEMPEQTEAKTRLPYDEVLSDKMNRMAIRHYMAGKYIQAMRCLNMAAEYNPTNTAAILNLAQLYLEIARDQQERREERLTMVKRFIKLSLKMQLSEIAQIRQHELVDHLRKPIDSLPKGSLGVLLR